MSARRPWSRAGGIAAGVCLLALAAGGGAAGGGAPEHRLGTLRFRLPAGFEVSERSVSETPSPIPGQPPTRETEWTLRGPGGEKVFLFHWQGLFVRDYGPMSERESWQLRFAGLPTRLIRTAMFMGVEREVLVVHADLGSEERAMIYTPDLAREAFERLLAGFERVDGP